VGNVYVGPHCGQDGVTITLGTFADYQCTEYIGYKYGNDVSTVLGEELEEDALKPWYNSGMGIFDDFFAGDTAESLCFPCNQNGDVIQSLVQSIANQIDYGNDDQNADDQNADDQDQNYMNELCESVYEISARCNMHYNSYRKMELSESERAEMKQTCSYIDSVQGGNYDERGFLNVKGSWLRDENSESQSSSYHSAREVTPLQIFGLLATISCCTILALWSKSLHTSLTKGEEWAPGARRAKRNWNIFRKPEEVERANVERADSGIGRVRSDDSYYVS